MAIADILYEQGLLSPTNLLTPVVTGHDDILYTASGGMITTLKVRGAIRHFSGQERDGLLEGVEASLLAWNKRRGTYLSFIHENDPDKVEGALANHHAPMRETMQRLGMPDGEHLLDSREQLLKPTLRNDELYVVVHTTVGTLDPNKRKKEGKRWGFPGAAQGGVYYEDLDVSHDHSVTLVKRLLSSMAVLFDVISAREGAALIATMWTRHKVEAGKFSLLGDDINGLLTEHNFKKKDGEWVPTLKLAEATLPRLGQQIFTDKVYYPIERDDTFIIRDHYQSVMRMTRSPSGKGFESYSGLRKKILRDTPFRLHLQLQSGEGSASSLGFKRIISLFLAVTQPKNLDISRSTETLTALEEAGYSNMVFRLSVTTWDRDPKQLERHIDNLTTAFSEWGNAGLTRIVDFPDVAAADSLPCGILRGPACFMPVSMLTDLLPIEIGASPWDRGLMMRSGENQPYPIDPSDKELMNFHIYILLGITGRGKSVTMTDVLKSCLFRPFLDELPLVRYLDVGYTSKAMFSYLRYMLPDDKRDQIVHYVMQNNAEHAVNPWDTPLGMRSQAPTEKSGLVELVEDALLAGGKLDGALATLLGALATEIVEEAYRMMADKGELRKVYLDVSDRHPKMVETIRLHEIEAIPSRTSWWSIVDALFEKGEIKMAEIAQRYAMPTFHDIPTVLATSTSIWENYDSQSPGGTEVISYARTVLMGLVTSYPVLSCETRLDYQAARIVGIDMQDVAISGKETNLFYSILQNVLSRGFMVDPKEVAKLDMPEQYRDYQYRRVRAVRASDKIFCYDELHRLSMGLNPSDPPPPAMQRLKRWLKEVRKYNIKLLLSTQAVTHMPPEIKTEEMWSLLFNMGVGGEQQKMMAELFDISEYGQTVMRNELMGPEAGLGAPCLFMANTTKGKIEQKIYVSTSPMELWAAPTDQNNLSLMEDVLEEVGDPVLAARALTQLFPRGSAKMEIDRLSAERNLTERQAIGLLIERTKERAKELQAAEEGGVAHRLGVPA